MTTESGPTQLEFDGLRIELHPPRTVFVNRGEDVYEVSLGEQVNLTSAVTISGFRGTIEVEVT